MQEITGDYWGLLGITGDYWGLLGITRDSWGLLGIAVKARFYSDLSDLVLACTHPQDDEWKEEEEVVQDLEGLKIQSLNLE